MRGNSTAPGPGEKGSKLWMQAIVNPDQEILQRKLLKGKLDIDPKKLEETLKEYKREIQEKLNFDDGAWISPLASEDYREYKLNQIAHKNIREKVLGIEKNDDLYGTIFKFWPSQQPVWDAIAKSKSKNTLFVFEAKAYTKEAKKECGSESKDNVKKIEKAMFEAYKYYIKSKSEELETWEGTKIREIWTKKYYQLGNRLTFLYNMNIKLKNIETILVLLNVVDDKTNKPTSEDKWKQFYKIAFKEMIGCSQPPDNVKVLLVNGSKGIELLWN